METRITVKVGAVEETASVSLIREGALAGEDYWRACERAAVKALKEARRRHEQGRQAEAV